MKTAFGTPRRRSTLCKVLSGVCALNLVLVQFVPLLALPQGQQVAHGDATFATQDGTLTITQGSDRAIINYTSFDIAQSESVVFVHPDSSAATLNRVLGGSRSDIAGKISAEGLVYLINPSGILFSETAEVNVGGLVAAAMDLSDSDFLAGNLRFTGPGGDVVNRGAIRASRLAYLLGHSVENVGSLSAPDVILAAGERSILIDRVEGGEIRLLIDEVAVDDPQGAPPEVSEDPAIPPEADAAINALTVINRGEIDAGGASGGSVTLEGVRVGQFGTIRADGTVGDGGDILLQASGSVVVGSDSITTASAGTHGDGGNIWIIGEDTARIGSGARIEARGGSESGDGGFVETSGRRVFEIHAAPDVSAPAGQGGTWYIDPHDITILNHAAGTHQNIDDAGDPWVSTADGAEVDIGLLITALGTGHVWIQTQDDAGSLEDGNITVLDAIDYSGTVFNLRLDAINDILINAAIDAGGNELQLDAGGDITQTAAITAMGLAFSAGGSVSLDHAANQLGTVAGTAVGNITIENAVDLDVDSLTSSGGNIAVRSDGALEVLAGGLLDSGGGDIDLVAGSGVWMQGSTLVDALGTGNVRLENFGGNISITGLIDYSAATYNLHLQAADDIMLDGGGFNAGANELRLDAGNDITQTGATAITAAGLAFSSGGNVTLGVAGNQLGTVAGTAVGNILIENAGDLTIGTVGTYSGLASTDGGDIDVTTVGSLELDATVDTTGSVSLEATAGAIEWTSGTVNAGALQLTAGTTIGTAADRLLSDVDTIEFSAGGSVYITDADAVTVAGQTTANDGDIDIATTAGTLTVAALGLQSGLSADGSGNVTLAAGGAGSDVVLNAAVASTAGDIAIQAQDRIQILPSGDLATAGDVSLTTLDGSIIQAISAGILADTLVVDSASDVWLLGDNQVNLLAGQAVGNLLFSNAQALEIGSAGGLDGLTAGGHIQVQTTAGALDLAQDVAAMGNVTLTAAGAITRSAGTVSGVELALTAGAGIGGAAAGTRLDTAVDRIVLDAGGAVYITEADDVTVAGVTANAGNIDIATTAGSLTVGAVGGVGGLTADGAGNVTLTAGGAGSDVAIHQALASGTGDIDITADNDVTSAAGGKITTGTPGEVSILAQSGNITIGGDIDPAEVHLTAAGDIDIDAAVQADDRITVTAGTVGGIGNVVLEAAGSLTTTAVGSDIVVTAGVTAGDIVLTGDVTALELVTLTASAGSIGGLGTVTADTLEATAATGIDLNTAVATLDAATTGTGNITILEADDIALADISVADGSFSLTTPGLVSVPGGATVTASDDITIRAGDVAFTDAASITSTGVGNLVLEPFALADSIGIGAGAGDFNLNATDIAALTDGFDRIRIGRLGGTGLVTIDGATFTDDLYIIGGAIVLAGDLDVGANDLTLEATTVSITQSGGTIAGANLLLSAAAGIGTAGARLLTDVDTIEFTAGDSVFITEADDVTVAGQTTPASDGAIDISTTAGTLTVGAVGAQAGLTADGSGDVTLSAGGAGSDVVIDAALASGTGDIDITAGTDVLTAAKITTGAPGIVTILAQSGNITIGGAIDPAEVHLTAAGDIDIDAAVEADNLITVTAGTGGSGSANINAGGSLETLLAGSDILVTAGTAGGDILVDGPITALDLVTLTAAAGSIGGAATVTAAELALRAQDGIGSGAQALITDVDLLALLVTDGPAYVWNAGSLTIGTVDGLVGATADSHVKIRADGVLTVDESVTAGGDVLLRTPLDDLALNAAVQAGRHMTIETFSGDVLQQANLTVGALDSAGTLDVFASGSILMNAASQTVSGGGNISYYASGGDIALGRLDAGAGHVGLNAGGDITDANAAALNIVAARTILRAGGSIGSAAAPLDTQVDVLAADAGGSIYIVNTGGLEIGAVVNIDVNLVNINSSLGLMTQSALAGATAGTDVKIEAAGALTVNEAVAAGQDVLLIAQAGNVTLDNDVMAGRHVHIFASGDVLQNLDLTVPGGTILIETDTGSITMAAGTVTTSDAIAYLAGQDVTVATLVGDNVWIETQNGDIIGLAGLNVESIELVLAAGGSIVGEPGELAFETDVDILAFDAGASVYIRNDGAFEIGTVEVTVNEIGMDSSVVPLTLGPLSGATAGTHVKLESTAGLTVSAPVTAGEDVLLIAQAGDVTLDGAIAAGGHVHIFASANVLQNAGITAAGSVLVEAATGAITMDTGTLTQADAIAYLAALDITVSVLMGDNVWIETATGDIHGLSGINVAGNELALIAGGSVGAPDPDAFTTVVNRLAVDAGVHAYIAAWSAVAVDPVGITYNTLAMDSTVTPVADTLSGVVAGNHFKLFAFDIAVNEAITVGQDLLFDSMGGLTLDAAVEAGRHLTILSGSDILQRADLSAGGADAAGTLLMSAWGSISMADGTESRTAGGNIAYRGLTGSIALGRLDAGSGRVAVDAFSHITDANASDLNLAAAEAILRAGGSIGSGADNLETQVAVLAASAGGSIYIVNDGDLAIGAVAALEVSRVQINSSLGTSTHALLAGATAGTHVKIEVDGSLTVAEAVTAGQDVLLIASNGNVTLDDAVDAGRHVNVLAWNDVLQNAAITAAGSALVWAEDGSVTMTADAVTTADQVAYVALTALTVAEIFADNVLLYAEAGDIAGLAGVVNVTAGELIVFAPMGSVGSDALALDTAVDRLAGMVGGSAYIRDTGSIAVDQADITIEIINMDSTVDEEPLGFGGIVAGVDAKIAAADAIAVNESMLTLTGDVLLAALGGDVTLDAAIDAERHVTVLAANDILQNADIESFGGTVLAAAGFNFEPLNPDVVDGVGDLVMASGVQTRTDGDNIFYAAGGDVILGTLDARTAADRAGETRNDQDLWGDVLVAAAGDFDPLAQTWNGGWIRAAAGSDLNVYADQVQLLAGAGIGQPQGSAGGPLQTEVAVLAATTWGSIYLSEATDLAVGPVAPIPAQIVGMDSSVLPIDLGGLQGLWAGENVKVETLDGTLTVAAGTVAGQVSGLDYAVIAGGDLLLQAQGANGDAVLDAAVWAGNHASVGAGADAWILAPIHSNGGDILVQAGGNVVIGANLLAGGNGAVGVVGGQDILLGAVSVQAGGNGVLLDAGRNLFGVGGLWVASPGTTVARAGNHIVLPGVINSGSLYASAGGNLLLGSITVADLLWLATGGTLQALQPLVATTVGLDAAGDIGTAAAPLRIDAPRLAVRSRAGSTYLNTMQDVQLVRLDASAGIVDVNRAGMDSGVEIVRGRVDPASLDGIDARRDVILRADGHVGGTRIVAGGRIDSRSRDFRVSQLRAGRIDVIAANIGMGRVNGGTANFQASGSVRDMNSLVNVNALTLIAGGDIGAEGRPINLRTRNIVRIAGHNVYLEERSNQSVNLGYIGARGFLSLSAPNIGLPDGSGGFLNANGAALNLQAGNGARLDVAGFLGTPADPLNVDIRGPVELKSGTLFGTMGTVTRLGTPPHYVYVMYEQDTTLTPLDSIRYTGDGAIPGLVIVNGQVLAGHPELIRRINRALAFTVDTPELKSRQGVFGNPFFVHEFMDISDVNVMGLLHFLLVSEALLLPDPGMELPPTTIRTGGLQPSTTHTIPLRPVR